MRDVLAFAGLTKPIAFDCLGENNRWRPHMLDGRLVCGMYFDGVMSAEPHARKLLI